MTGVQTCALPILRHHAAVHLMRATALLQVQLFMLAAVHVLVVLAESLFDQLLIRNNVFVNLATALQAADMRVASLAIRQA